MIEPAAVFGVSFALFSIGVLGFLTRRNILVLLMCVELMLNAGNLAFVAASRMTGNLDGQVMVFYVICVAAAEVAVGLALIVQIYRLKTTLNVDDINEMKG